MGHFLADDIDTTSVVRDREWNIDEWVAQSSVPKNTEVEDFKRRHLESNFVDAEWGGAEVDLEIVCWTGRCWK